MRARGVVRLAGPMRLVSLLGVVALALALLPGVSAAQDLERQVPFLADQGVVEIDPELREQLGLFAEFEGFRRARLFRTESGSLILELEGVRANVMVRERRTLSESALTDLRNQLSEAFGPDAARPLVTREGRGRLVLGQTLLGLGFHGWALPVALDLDSGQGIVATYLLTAGAHFYLPYRLTRDRSVTHAHQSFTNYGGSRGIAAGLLAGHAVEGEGDPTSDNGPRGTLAGGIIGGTVGSLAGFAAVERWAPDRGTADLWGHMGDVGFGAGAILGYLLGPYDTEEVIVRDGEFEYTESRIRNRSAGHAITLAGHGAGLAAGGWLGARRDYTSGNVSALRSATILGAQAGLTAGRLAGAEERALAAGVLAGGAAGVFLGDRLLTPVQFDSGEGLLINAGHLAGAALALGTTYLFVNEFENREKLYLTTSTAGAFLGAGLVWRAVSDEARARARAGGSGSPEAGSTRTDAGAQVQFNPGALLQGWLGEGPVPTLLSVRW